MDEPLVARGLEKSYRTEGGDLSVLRGLDLEVRPGEIVAIVGVSGVGKSTLLHLLGGLDRPDAGEVRVRGSDIGSLPHDRLAALRNREIGFVFQFHYLLPEFNALENVMMPLLIRRMSPSAARERSRRLLVDLGLGARLTHRPSRLSGGEQQRVAIARALVGEPAVLLADEPTGNLDPHTGAAVFELLRTLAKQREMGCVVATHNETLALTCDKILQLCEGSLREVRFGSTRQKAPEGPSPSREA